MINVLRRKAENISEKGGTHMRIEFSRKGKERKELVKAIEQITEKKSKYLGAPSMAYQIGEFTVTKDGAIESDDGQALEELTETLAFEGILSEQKADSLEISMPKERFTDEVVARFKNLVESKGELIKQALGADDLPIIEDGDKVTFPWFSETDADSTNAYLLLITKMTEMAENRTRISPKQNEIQNPKYEFRCFLLSLGFIGAEYKTARKILLKNLSGSSAFKSGKEVAE